MLKSFALIGTFVPAFMSVLFRLSESVACAPALFLAHSKEREPGKKAAEEKEQKVAQKAKGALQCDFGLFRMTPKCSSLSFFPPIANTDLIVLDYSESSDIRVCN